MDDRLLEQDFLSQALNRAVQGRTATGRTQDHWDQLSGGSHPPADTHPISDYLNREGFNPVGALMELPLNFAPGSGEGWYQGNQPAWSVDGMDYHPSAAENWAEGGLLPRAEAAMQLLARGGDAATAASLGTILLSGGLLAKPAGAVALGGQGVKGLANAGSSAVRALRARGGKKQAPLGQLFDKVDDPEQALYMALHGEHLRRQADGSYMGAPPGITSPQGLGRQRQKIDDLVDYGRFNYDWYDRARDTAVRFSPPGREDMQSLLSRSGAVYSPQAPPPNEVGSVLHQHNARVLEGRHDVPRMRAQARNVDNAYRNFESSGYGVFNPESIHMGPKTGPYGLAKDPTVPDESLYRSANDIWHGRVMGWGDDFNRGFTPTEHNYLTGENLLLAQRANDRDRARGMYNEEAPWTPRRGQAATWGGKRKEAYISEELERIEQANRTRRNPIVPDMADIERRAERYAKAGIDDAVEGHSAYLTSEARTGANVGHLPMDDPRQIDSYTDLVRDQTARRDPVMDSMSMYSAEAEPTRGHFRNSQNEVENNPGWSNQVLVATDGASDAAHRTTDSSRGVLDFATLTGAVNRAQEGGGWSRPLPSSGQRVSDLDSVVIDYADDPARKAAAIRAAEEVGAEPLDYGGKIQLHRFENVGKGTGNAPGQKEMFTRPKDAAYREKQPAHESALLGDALKRQGVDDFYVTHNRFEGNYEDTLLGRNASPQGDLFAGSAEHAPAQTTRNLLNRSGKIEQVVPGIEQRTARALAEEYKVQNEIDRAIEAASGLPTQEALFKLRDVMSQGGIPALRKFIKEHGHAGLPAGLLAVVGAKALSDPEFESILPEDS